MKQLACKPLLQALALAAIMLLSLAPAFGQELVQTECEASGFEVYTSYENMIDYMQKVPVHPEPPNEVEKVTSVVQGLKDLALNYEADIIVILNEKYQIVAKVNIEFNPYQAQRFRDWVVLTVEKNRGGTNAVDLEYQKYFEYSCFDPNGRTVMEKLIEERLYND